MTEYSLYDIVRKLTGGVFRPRTNENKDSWREDVKYSLELRSNLIQDLVFDTYRAGMHFSSDYKEDKNEESKEALELAILSLEDIHKQSEDAIKILKQK